MAITRLQPVLTASVRMASGEMIEQVVDAMIAKPQKTVDDAFIDELYKNMVSLYHLDGVGRSNESTSDALPPFSIALISVLGAIWLSIGAYALALRVKKMKAKKKFSDNY